MFYKDSKDYLYLGEPLDYVNGENLCLPLEIDTEYVHLPYDINHPNANVCTTLTVQCRSITKDSGLIYAHPENKEPRHKVTTEGFVGITYLEDLGYSVQLSRVSNKSITPDMPCMKFDIFSFFAVAELARMFQGAFRADILNLVTNPGGEGIEQGRRMRTYTQAGKQLFNWVEPSWLLCIDGCIYRVRIEVFDTCAVHGKTNYQEFCSNSNIVLAYKDNFTKTEKSRMDDMYSQRPEDFDNYAKGDLYNHDALMGNASNFERIYESLDLARYYIPPRMTIGATISRLFEGSIKNLFDGERDDNSYINAFCKYSSADWLKRKTTTTACLNAKVDGGRCRNNRPLDTVAKGVLCDIDISSCYGEGLRVQTYPLGIPLIIDYPIKSKHNKYQTLRQFLKTYGKELVPGLWQCRVSTPEDYKLKYKQDYLASWFPPNDLSKMVTDSEFEETDQWWTVDNVGEIKILNHEVCHAIVTHEFVQWLDNVATPRQRKELLDNLLVETAMFYPASERVDSVAELMSNHEEHKGVNTTKVSVCKRSTKKIAIEMECHSWYGINLGELLVDKLLLERKKYPKKTPLNTLYKLCVNTLYGDMVSPFFTIGNTVVGNNITARARGLAWCMEKGLNGWETITDGCVFDMNRVLYPKGENKITGELTVNLYKDSGYRKHTLAPLNSDNELSVTLNSNGHYLSTNKGCAFVSGMNPSEAMGWTNIVAMKHLQELFPGLDVLHKNTLDVYGNERIGQFSFEVKGFHDKGIFHGSANYLLQLNNEKNLGMRSYSKKGAKVVTWDEGINVSEEPEQIAEKFLMSLENTDSVPRGVVYINNRILKLGDYKNNFNSWRNGNSYPGCSIETVGLLHEFSLSQFTFNTYKQYLSWKREYERLMRKYGQSYEMFFLNEDGTLRYQEMIETVDGAIRADKMNFFDGLDKRQVHLYRQYIKHQDKNLVERVRLQLDKQYRTKNEE
ncbi:MAG: hypothetical protein F6K62_17860 [Sphaerospermopsis sp. SIO1G2]|nr:hypothetical protein [Sphaerospermopsis sp. SIO1G1]NET72720.1 hypothetical protein [Sphaerospermopsis sp. SIO1G2]